MNLKSGWIRKRVSTLVKNWILKKSGIDMDVKIYKLSVDSITDGEGNEKSLIHLEADGLMTKEQLDTLIFIKMLGL